MATRASSLKGQNKLKPMIKLFRKIRQKLLQQNKVGSYLKYAIGEIVLVVIGILIALQINNWNESRKTEAKIRNLLVVLRSDLVQDTLLITEQFPFIISQYQLNESLRARVGTPMLRSTP